MRLNQVTVTMADLDAGGRFYSTLGLKPIVDARPRYARFVCPDGDSTFSLHQGESDGGGTTIYFECENLDQTVSNLKQAGLRFVSGPEDKSWHWREAELFDPGGNRIILYYAGANRIDPPWRVTR
ncbi:VOC family protein [Sinorhizobium meliloti]|uniref:VOC family protein n=1 Tax=Rhizobium meliloti TaxID=382 RepID=UPI000405299B|nr:VOC family protein [Sinorhizobium meliloti]